MASGPAPDSNRVPRSQQIAGALRHAAQSAPHLPDLTVRRDNGGAFVTHNYQDRFIERNTRARKQRMRTIRQDPDRQPKNKTFGDKIGSVTKQIVKTLSTDNLYVINEIIRHRFPLIET